MFGTESDEHLSNRKQGYGTDAGVARGGALTCGGWEVLSEELTPSHTWMMRTEPWDNQGRNSTSFYSLNRTEIIIVSLKLRKLILREVNDLPPITQLDSSWTEIHTPPCSKWGAGEPTPVLTVFLTYPILTRRWSHPEVQSWLPSSEMHPSIHLANVYPSSIDGGHILIQTCMGHEDNSP